MASTEAERLHEIYVAYKEADRALPRDLREAQSEEDVVQILETVNALKAAYYRAARVALDANGDLVEAAFESARRGNQAIRGARERAAELPERIRLGVSLFNSVDALITAADDG